MGRKNKKYYKNLHDQAYDKLTSMQAFGESKKEAVLNGSDKNKIFSFNTYKTYWKHIKYFIRWMQQNYPEIKTLKKARAYVPEWLQSRVDQIDKNGNHLSAWTIQTEAKALAKLFDISPDDSDYFSPPKRRRVNIKRSRGAAVRDRHFSEKNNWELVCFARGTGLRRSELEALKGGNCKRVDELYKRLEELQNKPDITTKESQELKSIRDVLEQFPDEKYFVWVANGKGGRSRYSPILGDHKQDIVDRIKNTDPDKNVWEYVSSNADIHGYRADYATMIYKAYARDIKDIPYDKINKGTGKKYQGDVYVCRGDEKGKKLDKRAMLKASKALGHNRIDVVANNYLRSL